MAAEKVGYVYKVDGKELESKVPLKGLTIVYDLREAIWNKSSATFQRFEGITGDEHLSLWKEGDVKSLTLNRRLFGGDDSVFKVDDEDKKVVVTTVGAESWDAAFVASDRLNAADGVEYGKVLKKLSDLEVELKVKDERHERRMKKLSDLEVELKVKDERHERRIAELESVIAILDSTTQNAVDSGQKLLDISDVLSIGALTALLGKSPDSLKSDIKAVKAAFFKKLSEQMVPDRQPAPVDKKRKGGAGSGIPVHLEMKLDEDKVQVWMFLFCLTVQTVFPSVCWTAYDTSKKAILPTLKRPDITLCADNCRASWQQMVSVIELKSRIYSTTHYKAGIAQLNERAQMVFREQPDRTKYVGALAGGDAVEIWVFHRTGQVSRSSLARYSLEDEQSASLELLMRYLLASKESYGFIQPAAQNFGPTGLGAQIQEPVLTYRKDKHSEKHTDSRSLRTSRVYRGMYVLDDETQIVAIKTGPEVEQEHAILEQLKDVKGVVNCKEYWSDDGTDWLATYPFGESLFGAEPAVTLEVVAQVALTIQELYKKKFLHRDVSVGNIMFTSDATGVHAYLIDFATAAKTDDQGEVQGNGPVTGTYSFMGLSVHHDKVHCLSSELESLLYVLIDVSMDGYLPWHPRKVGWNRKLVVAKKYHAMHNIDRFEAEVLSMIYSPTLKLAVSKLRNIFFEPKHTTDVSVDSFLQALRAE